MHFPSTFQLEERQTNSILGHVSENGSSLKRTPYAGDVLRAKRERKYCHGVSLILTP